MEYERLSRDQYFMELAEAAAKRGTCPRAIVGCVIVLENRPVTTGYNSSNSRTTHCCDEEIDGGGCLIIDGHCVRVIHAEISAIRRLGIDYGAPGLIAYVTHEPCINCYKELVAAGVKEIFYRNTYKFATEERKVLDILIQENDVEVIELPKVKW